MAAVGSTTRYLVRQRIKAGSLANLYSIVPAARIPQTSSLPLPSQITEPLHLCQPALPIIQGRQYHSTMSEKPLYFWRETSGDGTWLSQWYYAPFYDEDGKTIYKTAEQYA